MRKNEWKLQDAKNQFSELINQAQESPQTVTRRGEEVAVILSRREYERLTAPAEGLVEFFARSPLKGLDLDLSREDEPPRDLEL